MLNSKDAQIVLDAIEETDLLVIAHIRDFDENAIHSMLAMHTVMCGILSTEIKKRKTRGETI